MKTTNISFSNYAGFFRQLIQFQLNANNMPLIFETIIAETLDTQKQPIIVIDPLVGLLNWGDDVSGGNT